MMFGPLVPGNVLPSGAARARPIYNRQRPPRLAGDGKNREHPDSLLTHCEIASQS
jgi:hypothetical protein